MPRLYLSPSLQDFNLYSGGGNEQYYMNLLADRLEPYLFASGVQYIRNEPASQELRDVIDQSNRSDIDLHLALHSNAAGAGKEGQLRGVEVYYNAASSFSRKAAELLAQQMRSIYPLPDKVRLVPAQQLAEVLQVHAPSVLLEVAYHDNWEDAQWIRENLGEIARAVAKGVCAYFGIPFVEPQPARIAMVHTGGARLNLRQFPSTESRVLAGIPDGSRLLLHATIGNGWSVVSDRENTGYVKSEYLI